MIQKMVILDAHFSIMAPDLPQFFIVHCDFHVHLGQIRQHDGIGSMVQVVCAAFLLRAPGILPQPFFSETAGNVPSDTKYSGLSPGKLQMVLDEPHHILCDISGVIDISGLPPLKDFLCFLSEQCRKHQVIIFFVADRVTCSFLFCFDTFDKRLFLFSFQIHERCLLSFRLIFVSADKGFIRKRIIQDQRIGNDVIHFIRMALRIQHHFEIQLTPAVQALSFLLHVQLVSFDLAPFDFRFFAMQDLCDLLFDGISCFFMISLHLLNAFSFQIAAGHIISHFHMDFSRRAIEPDQTIQHLSRLIDRAKNDRIVFHILILHQYFGRKQSFSL